MSKSSHTPATLDSADIAVSVCFLLSGFAGLLYETVWLRQLATVFGTSDAALGAVLAAYMGGLALGAAVAGRFVNRIRRPVLVYGLLELGVALGALAVPYGLQAISAVRVAVCGGLPDLPTAGGLLEVMTDVGLTCTLILIPTACMGATLPMLARHVLDNQQRGANPVGWLYGINTAGAVLGTLVTAFALLPTLGLQATTLVGAGINVLVFVIAARLQKTRPAMASDDSPQPAESDENTAIGADSRLSQRLLIVLMGLSSAASFVYEVLWTRLLSQVLGSSVHSFATMLASFLTGIALGSCLTSQLLQTGSRPLRLFVGAQAVIALTSAAVFSGVDLVHELASGMGSGISGGFIVNMLLCLVMLLPSTVAIGMALPLAIRLAARPGEASRTTARLYAASTVGAIVGALVAGHALLPLLGYSGTVAVAVAINFVVFFCGLLAARPKKASAAASTLLPAAAVILLYGGGPESILRVQPLEAEPAQGEIIYFDVGECSTVLMSHQNHRFRLMTNGLPESLIAPSGAGWGSEDAARWLSALPLLARPEARSMLVIGFGGGVSVSGVPESVESIDVIELEPAVIEANRAISSLRLHDPLSDPRLRLTLNDARGALSLTTRKWDVVIAQASHPWTSGASHLYTREFQQLVRSRMSDDGVFLQWINAYYLSPDTLRSLGQTLLSAFKHVRLYSPRAGELLFLCSEQPLNVEEQLVESGIDLHGSSFHQSVGLNGIDRLAAALLLDRDGLARFSAGAEVITDNWNRLATSSASTLQSEENLWQRLDVLFPFDAHLPLEGEDSLCHRIGLDPVRLIRRLLTAGEINRAVHLTRSLQDDRNKLLAAGLIAQAQLQLPVAAELYQAALAAAPNDQFARYKAGELILPQVMRGEHPGVLTLTSGDTVDLRMPVIEAAQAFFRQDWPALANLEDQLAAAQPHDGWWPLATGLRAEWRTRLDDPEHETRHAQEAIDLINQVYCIEPSLLAARTRLRAAERLGHLETWLESVHLLHAQFTERPQTVSGELRAEIRTRVKDTAKQFTPNNDWQRMQLRLATKLFDMALPAAPQFDP